MALPSTRRIELNARNVSMIFLFLVLIAALAFLFVPHSKNDSTGKTSGVSTSQATPISGRAGESAGVEEQASDLGGRGAFLESGSRPFDLFAKLTEARAKDKHVLAYFFRRGDGHKWDELIEKARSKWPREMVVAYVPMEDTKARPLVKKYGLRVSPTMLVFAPNGAVTAGFVRNEPDLNSLARSFVSAKMSEVILSVQEKRFVFLLLGREEDRVFQQNLKIAKSSADELEGMAKVVYIDRRKDEASDIIANLRINESGDASHTYVISPAGGLVAHFEGGITEDNLFDSFSKVLAQRKGCGAKTVTGGSSCEPGKGVSGSGGCGESSRSLQ